MKLDTGLPGRPMNHADEPSPRRTSPNASGLPGLIAIYQRSSRPSACTAGLQMVFLADRDAAAGDDQVVALGGAPQRLARVASSRSGTMPRSSQPPPSASTRPRSVKRFEL